MCQIVKHNETEFINTAHIHIPNVLVFASVNHENPVVMYNKLTVTYIILLPLFDFM